MPSIGLKHQIVLKLGDLADSKVEAIVNAGNTWLKLGGGVSGVIRDRGGTKIQAELNRIKRGLPTGSVLQGEAVVTSGGDLWARFVIHAAVVGPEPVTAEIIKKCLTSVFRCASAVGCRSIALPALGTGTGGLPMAQCAQVMAEEIPSLLAQHASLLGAMLVLFRESDLKIFRATFEANGIRYRLQPIS